MSKKPILEELKQRVKKLEQKTVKHKQTEEVPRESEERYRTLIENIPVGIYRTTPGPKGKFLMANPAYLKMFGFESEEELKKFCVADRFMVPNKRTQHSDNLVAQGSVTGFELLCKRKDGISLLGSFNIKVVCDEKGKVSYFDGIVEDITERRRIEEALQRAHNELEKRVEERTSELSRVNEKLKNKTINLEEANIALKVLLEKRGEDKIELEEKVLSNVKELTFPYIENLKMSRLDDRQMGLLGIIESNLNEIITPFLRKLSSKYSNLTPKEIQVAGLVKEGKTSKEIAELLDSSKNAVEFHRRNLRKKLGIRNTKTNLSSYLLSLP